MSNFSHADTHDQDGNLITILKSDFLCTRGETECHDGDRANYDYPGYNGHIAMSGDW